MGTHSQPSFELTRTKVKEPRVNSARRTETGGEAQKRRKRGSKSREPSVSSGGRKQPAATAFAVSDSNEAAAVAVLIKSAPRDCRGWFRGKRVDSLGRDGRRPAEPAAGERAPPPAVSPWGPRSSRQRRWPRRRSRCRRHERLGPQKCPPGDHKSQRNALYAKS